MKYTIYILTLLMTIQSLSASTLTKLTPEQVRNELNKNPFIYDVNPQKIYLSGHIPTSKNIPFHNLLSYLPINKEARLIFYCKNEMCSASHQAALEALNHGYKNVAQMPAGIDGWINAQFPLEK